MKEARGRLLEKVDGSGRVVQLLHQSLYERLDGLFIAPEEMPLTDLLAADQTGSLQGRQMRRNGGLGKPGTLIDLPGADAVLNRVFLRGKRGARVLEPGQDLSADRMGQRFDDVVEVDGHVVLTGGVAIYRDGANLISVFRDIQI